MGLVGIFREASKALERVPLRVVWEGVEPAPLVVRSASNSGSDFSKVASPESYAFCSMAAHVMRLASKDVPSWGGSRYPPNSIIHEEQTISGG
jgi:hypothetical protein